MSELGVKLAGRPVVLCRVLVFAGRRPAPSRRQVGGSQSTLRRTVGRRVFNRLFGRVAVSRRVLLRSQRVAQDIVDHLGARLCPIAKRRRHLRANRASIRLTGTEPA